MRACIGAAGRTRTPRIAYGNGQPRCRPGAIGRPALSHSSPCLTNADRRRGGAWLLLFALCPALAAAPIEHVTGKAYAADGRLLYSESHWLFDADAEPSRVVLYRCPDGRPFARKVVSRRGPAQAPDFELVEQPLGYREGIRSGAHGRQVFVQRGSQAAERSAPLAATPVPVADAGFDAWIQAHWNQLGERAIEVPFVLPSRLRTYNVRIRRMADRAIDGRPARQYRISLSSWFGFVLPHVDASYDVTSHQLRRLSGLGNIRGANGHNLDVRVEFAASGHQPNRLAEAQAALTEPLDGRCEL